MASNPESEEKIWLKRLRNGDEIAFNAIYNQYKRRLSVNLQRLLKSKELVEETLQDIFLKVWLNREKLDPEQSVRGYLFRIAENIVADIFRRAAREQKLQRHLCATLSELYSPIEEYMFAEENREMLQAIIELLPPQRKTVFVLCKLEEKSYQEVSDLLGISINTVKEHIIKANSFLKDRFSGRTNTFFILFIAAMFQLI